MAFAGNGERLAVDYHPNRPEGADHRLAVLDIEKKAELWSVDAGFGVGNLCFSPDGPSWPPASHTISNLDASTGKPTGFPVPGLGGGHDVGGLTQDAVFSSDGRRLAGISGQKQVKVCDVPTGTLIDSFDPPASSMGLSAGPVAFSPDGRTLAVAGGPKVLHFWDLESHRDRLAMSDTHADQVNGVLFTRDGKMLISASDDGTIRLWDLAAAGNRES